ncbi:MAG: hypothetical protein GX493_06075 [Firmicutes bacterium]|nr:hypothetical protein [Bacillota bacterium]
MTVDLEGDGGVETIISATNIAEENINVLYNSEGEEALDRCSLVLLLTGDGTPVLLAEKYEGISPNTKCRLWPTWTVTG